MFIFTIFIIMNTWASDHLSVKDRLRLTLYAPAMYVLLYTFVFVEYVALMKSAGQLLSLRKPNTMNTTWKSPIRSVS